MKIKLLGRRLLVILIISGLIVLLFPISISAKKMVNTEEKTSLTICYPVAGASFQIYRVASIKQDGSFILSDQFANYAVSLEQPDEKGWADAAFALEAYVARDQLTPEVDGKTDQNGKVTFTSLVPGLYLVTGDTLNVDGYKYTPKAFFISLSNLNGVDQGQQVVIANPKYDRENETTQEEKVERRVLKVWRDKNQKKRPQKVVIQLLQNGKVWDTVTLDDKNNWSHIWTELDNRDRWQIVEKDVPKGYVVTVGQEGNTFVVTNRLKRIVGDDELSIDEDTEEVIQYEEHEETSQEEDVLPQTGQLWWPVPLLAAIGMILFLSGWLMRRKDDNNE